MFVLHYCRRFALCRDFAPYPVRSKHVYVRGVRIILRWVKNVQQMAHAAFVSVPNQSSSRMPDPASSFSI